jgi:hypothetical protein
MLEVCARSMIKFYFIMLDIMLRIASIADKESCDLVVVKYQELTTIFVFIIIVFVNKRSGQN